MSDDRPAGFGAWTPDSKFRKPFGQTDDAAGPATAPDHPWDDDLDDVWEEWIDPADPPDAAVTSEPASSPLLDAMRRAGEKMHGGRSPEEIRADFPPVEVADEVEEDIDDLIPDIDESGPAQWQQALLIIAAGLDKCAALKQVVTSGLWDPIERQVLAEIRADKERLIARRAVYRDLLEGRRLAREQHGETARPAPGPLPNAGRGFLAWGSAPSKTDAEYAAERRQIVKETNDYISELHEERMQKNRELAERRHKQFMDSLMGRRRYVVIRDDEYLFDDPY